MGDRLGLHVLAADLERRALLGVGHLEAGDAHALLGELRIAGAGDDPDLAAVGPDLVAEIHRAVMLDEHAEDLEAFPALELVVLLGTAESGLAGAHREVEAQLPQRVAGGLVGEGIHLRVVVRIEQQVGLDAQHVEHAEADGDDAHRLALVEDGVPDHRRVLAAHEDLVAALAGVAGARDHDGGAEQRRLHVVEVLEVADARHVLGEEVHCERALQREIVEIVIEQHGDVAAHGGLDDLLMRRARAVHQHEGVGAGAIDDAVIGEHAAVIQHAGIDRLARIDLVDVAGGDVVEHRDRVGPHEVDLLEARNIHQSGLGAHRDVLGVDVLVVGPGGSHAAPVLKLRTESAVAVGEDRKSPGQRHVTPPNCFLRGIIFSKLYTGIGEAQAVSCGKKVEPRRGHAARIPGGLN